MLLPIGFWAQDKRRCVVNGEKIAFKLQHLFRLSPIHNEGAKLSGSNAKGLTVQSPNERPVNNADKPMIILKFLALINCSCVMYLQLLGGFQLRKSGKLKSDLKEVFTICRIAISSLSWLRYSLRSSTVITLMKLYQQNISKIFHVSVAIQYTSNSSISISIQTAPISSHNILVIFLITFHF